MFKKIAVIGAGGIGSNLLAILFDYGHNRKQFDYGNTEIDVYDSDSIDVTNLLHQNFKLDDVGKNKVQVMEDRYIVNGIPEMVTDITTLKDYDLVFSCVDNLVFRSALYKHTWEHGGPMWIDGRCTSRQGALFTSDMPKDYLSQFINESTESGSCLLAYEKEQNISHTLPLIVAGMMVQAFLNKIRGQQSGRMTFMI